MTGDLKVAEAALPYLVSSGWINSRRVMVPVDADSRPLPWYTYAAIDFLSRRVQPDMQVFEFGSGNSTLWWAERAAMVTTVEHHPVWAEGMASRVPANVELLHVPLEPDAEYCRTAGRERGRFHIVVVDGRDRCNCARQCLAALREDGVVVWDDSQRKRYRPGQRFLERRGFRQLPFASHGPINPAPWETSVFYRTENCLGI